MLSTRDDAPKDKVNQLTTTVVKKGDPTKFLQADGRGRAKVLKDPKDVGQVQFKEACKDVLWVGDVITQVNGAPTGTLQKVLDALQPIGAEAAFTVDFERVVAFCPLCTHGSMRGVLRDLTFGKTSVRKVVDRKLESPDKPRVDEWDGALWRDDLRQRRHGPQVEIGQHVTVTDDRRRFETACKESKLSFPDGPDGPRLANISRPDARPDLEMRGTVVQVYIEDDGTKEHHTVDIEWDHAPNTKGNVPIRALVNYSNWQPPGAITGEGNLIPPPPWGAIEDDTKLVDHRVTCGYCNQKFTDERIDQHEKACRRRLEKYTKYARVGQ